MQGSKCNPVLLGESCLTTQCVAWVQLPAFNRTSKGEIDARLLWPKLPSGMLHTIFLNVF